MNNLRQQYIEAFKSAECTTQAMQTAIGDWFNLYYNQTVPTGEDPCQELPYTIVRKLSKAAFGEYKASSKNAFADGILQALSACRKKAVQLSYIGGECLIKPIPGKTGFTFMPISRRNLLVFARNGKTITDVGSAEVTKAGNSWYTLLERRTVENDRLHIRYTAYQSQQADLLGSRIPLASYPKYKGLPDELEVPLDNIGLISLSIPIENTVDGSDDPVSVYAKASRLIHNINHNEYLLDGEFDRGQSKLMIPADLVRKDQYGVKRPLADDVFIGLDGDPEEIPISIFSPALREASFHARTHEYLRACENIIGLKRGLLSEVEAVERTATEVHSSEGEYAMTIADLQEEWEHAVRQAMDICAVLGRHYNVPGAVDVADEDITIDWGNGVLYDEDADRAVDLDLVARGLLKPEIVLAKRYGLPYETEADLEAVRVKYMPDAKRMTEEV